VKATIWLWFVLALIALWVNGQIAYGQGIYEAAIHDACARHGCDGDQLVRVMYCESGGDPSAVGPNGERGLFQYHPQSHNMAGYWAWEDPYLQIEIAAADWAAGLGGMWSCQ
jgi:hypothetical protein